MVKAHIPGPVQRDVKSGDDVRPQPVLIVSGIVDEFRERLPAEGVPVAVEQRVAQLCRLALQLDLVIKRDVRVVPHRGRDVLDHAPGQLRRAVLTLHLDHPLVRLFAHVRPVHEVVLHPGVARPAGVARAPHAWHNPQLFVRAQAGSQVLVHRLREVRQLVEVQPVNLRALIPQQALSLVVQVAEVQHAAVLQPELVCAGPVPPKARRDDRKHRLNQRLLQLRVCPAEQIGVRPLVHEAPVQRVPADRVALAAARRAAVEHLMRRRLVEDLLLCGRHIVEVDDHSSSSEGGMPAARPVPPSAPNVMRIS